MAAVAAIQLQPGDEVILPSFTIISLRAGGFSMPVPRRCWSTAIQRLGACGRKRSSTVLARERGR